MSRFTQDFVGPAPICKLEGHEPSISGFESSKGNAVINREEV